MGRSGKGKGVVIEVPLDQMRIKSFPPTVLVQTPSQRRADQVVRWLHAELKSGVTSALHEFLLHYFVCEIHAKLLQGGKKGIPPAKALKKSVNLGSLKSALLKFGMNVSPAILDRVFGTVNESVKKRSAKKLRDKIVHELNINDIDEVHRRGASLVKDMQRFIEVVDAAANKSKAF